MADVRTNAVLKFCQAVNLARAAVEEKMLEWDRHMDAHQRLLCEQRQERENELASRLKTAKLVEFALSQVCDHDMRREAVQHIRLCHGSESAQTPKFVQDDEHQGLPVGHPSWQDKSSWHKARFRVATCGVLARAFNANLIGRKRGASPTQFCL